jgi:hypothetical protein
MSTAAANYGGAVHTEGAANWQPTLPPVEDGMTQVPTTGSPAASMMVTVLPAAAAPKSQYVLLDWVAPDTDVMGYLTF